MIHSPVKKVANTARLLKDSTPKKSTPLKQSFKDISSDSEQENKGNRRSTRMSTRSEKLTQNKESGIKKSRIPLGSKPDDSDGGSNKSTPTKPQSVKTPKTQTIKRVADQNLAITPNEDEHPTPSKSVRTRKSLGLKDLDEPETPSTPVKHKRSQEHKESTNKKQKWSTTVKPKKINAVNGIHSMVTTF